MKENSCSLDNQVNICAFLGTLFESFVAVVQLMHFLCLLGQICVKFGASLESKLFDSEETAPFNGAIWDEFREQHKHQSKKTSYLMLN